VEHDLFEDTPFEGPPGAPRSRRLAPHLASLNFSFALNSRSSIFRWLGFAGDGADPADDEEAEEEDELDDTMDPFGEEVGAEAASIIPGARRSGTAAATRRSASGGTGGWDASFNFSMQRPRDEALPASKMLGVNVRMQPTELWDLTWRTSYDLESRQFNDHTIRLSRDLHRWEAHFDFRKTVTGNWSFQFEVALMDNRDLKFDYQQRNLDVAQRGRGF